MNEKCLGCFVFIHYHDYYYRIEFIYISKMYNLCEFVTLENKIKV